MRRTTPGSSISEHDWRATSRPDGRRRRHRAAIELARNLRADVVGFVATPEYKMHVIKDAVFAPGTLSEADFSKAVKRKEVSWRDREDGAGCGRSVQRGVGDQ